MKIQTNNYNFSLAKRGKWICPKCGRKTFVCYVDANGNVLDTKVGKCDRADKCQYHYPPRDYFAENNITDVNRAWRRTKPIYKPLSKYTYIDNEVFKKSVTATANHRNNLVDYLKAEFSKHYAWHDADGVLSHIDKAVKLYYIGTSNHFGGGATVFYQVDKNGKVCRGKVMQYDATTGKRVKEPFNKFTTVHKLMGLEGDLPPQRLFGEHLLNEHKDKSVVIVESEKTALILACFVDDAIMLATGGCGNLSESMCEALKGREVVLFPDNGKYQEWKEKGASMARKFAKLEIAKVMEVDFANIGDDIGDLVISRYPDISDIDFKLETIK